jgi:ubiquitin C-terminal hydrolase
MKLSRSLLQLLTGYVAVILQLIKVLNLPARKEKTRSVEPVIIALEEMYNSRISRNQQDSQEFLHLIHEALSLEDALLKKEDPDPEKLQIPPNPFEGQLSTQIECQGCGFTTPWKNEEFTELSVAVPSKVLVHR